MAAALNQPLESSCLTMIKSLFVLLLGAAQGANPNLLRRRDGLYVGAGIEAQDASVLGSPFDQSSVVLKQEDVSMKGSIKMDVV